MTDTAPTVCLLGASPDTGNLGVSALSEASLAALAQRSGDADLAVFDNGLGVRDDHIDAGDQRVDYRRYGLRVSRRIYRSESLVAMRLAVAAPVLPNPGVAALRRARAVFDISGGDSFSDIYGGRRFELVARPKRLALQLGRPLVLLPQTYGPFRGALTRRIAERIVRRATSAWARDPDSFAALQDLLGDAFDPRRHRAGVDVAFGLPSHDPTRHLSPQVRGWLASAATPVVGLNVSGLIANDANSGSRYSLRADYRLLVRRLVERLLSTSGDVRVVLIPHVFGGVESDLDACRALYDSLAPRLRSRADVVEARLSPRQVKGLIGELSWFCGTRMHSTIAALSSGVPAAAIAYSIKTRGVFETCGEAGAVADARSLVTDEALDVLWQSWTQREAACARLAATLPKVLDRAAGQWDELLAVVRQTGVEDRRPTARRVSG